MSIKDLFKKKRKRENLYFAVVIANKSLEAAKFEMDQDCKIFIVTGDVEKHDIIPKTVLKSMVEKFMVTEKLPGDLKIGEAKITEKSE